MKHYLLPETGNFYKANLHCHSTCSDGQWTPEELKEQYMKQGYSIIAYTDHQLMYNHSYLTDENGCHTAVYLRHSGLHTLYLKTPATVYEVYEKKIYGEDITELTFEAYFGETKMFRIETK